MILDRFLVTDQAAIVTASGRGIGAGTAVALAQAGADVVLAARTEEQLRETAKEVEAAGRRAIVVPGDLTDYDLMASLAETAFNEFGRLDIVMSSEELKTAMEEATPLKRLGQVEDIAAAIVYLVSPAGSYVTGKVIEVDGGLQSPNLELPLPDL